MNYRPTLSVLVVTLALLAWVDLVLARYFRVGGIGYDEFHDHFSEKSGMVPI